MSDKCVYVISGSTGEYSDRDGRQHVIDANTKLKYYTADDYLASDEFLSLIGGMK